MLVGSFVETKVRANPSGRNAHISTGLPAVKSKGDDPVESSPFDFEGKTLEFLPKKLNIKRCLLPKSPKKKMLRQIKKNENPG
jgi:hypothetical protein